MWSQANTTTLLVVALLGGIVWPQNEARAEGRSRPRDLLEKLDFEGGTVLDYVEKVKASHPDGECNLVINRSDWASEVSMPPVSLKMVSVDTALSLIELVADSEEYHCRLHSSGNGEVFILRIEKRGDRKRKEPSPPSRRVEAFSLASGAPAGLSPKGRRITSLLTAIDDALRLQNPSEKDKAKIRFHPDSGLLLVFGTGEETRIVSEVVDRFSVDWKREKELKDLRAEREEFLGQIRDLTAQLEHLKDVRTALDVKMRALDEERSEGHNEIVRLKQHLENILLENQRLRAELAALKEKTKRR